MRIGILTGGGDVPGLNACIKAVVGRATEAGHEVVGIRRGWGGLVEANVDVADGMDASFVPLTPSSVRTIDRFGGTTLHTSRTNPAKVALEDIPERLRSRFGPADNGTPNKGTADNRTADLTPFVLEVLEQQEIDVLVPIGGDDTLSYALRMHDEGMRVVAIPKTMDNDVHGTDYCIGFSTAVTRSVEFVHALRTSTGSHERIAVVELFGRYSGETSLITAYLAGVDRCVISEVPVDVDRLAELLVDDRRRNASRYAMVTVSEGSRLVGGDMVQGGAADAYGHQKLGGVGLVLSGLLEERTGEGIIYQQVAYLMRSGSPDSLDLMVATNYAVMAADLAGEGSSGRMVALRSGTYTNVPISVTREGVKRVDVDELYDVASYRPKVRHVGGKPMFLY